MVHRVVLGNARAGAPVIVTLYLSHREARELHAWSRERFDELEPECEEIEEACPGLLDAMQKLVDATAEER